MLSTGHIKSDTLVWQEGMANWLPYGQISGAVGAIAAPPGMVACSYCKKPFPMDEVISMNGQTVCSNCKPIALQMIKEGVAAPGEMVYARFGIRFGAKIIDGIIGYIIGIVVGVLAGLTRSEAAPLIASLLGFLVQLIYAIYFYGKFGATLGKMACGLRVVRPDGSRLTYGRAAGRYFAEILSGVTLGIGYLMAGFDAQGRSLHDRVADTRVVKK